MRAPLLYLALAIAATASAQTQADPNTQFKQRAASAVAAERTREKMNLCRNPSGQVTCLGDELDRSNKNYLQLARAVGGLLRIYVRDDTDANTKAIGTDFDDAESAWAKYRIAECEAVSEDLHAGMMNGHPWALDDARCELAVTRQHIYELNTVYNWLWTR